jgi:CheY-like chemotaxis protein
MAEKILIVDDEPMIRRLFSRVLRAAGYQTVEAEDGHAALAALTDTTFDLMLLDLRMPGMNGVETLRTMHQRGIGVRVYVVTAFHSEFTADLKALTAEGIGFNLLKKPIDAQDLLLAVRAAFGGAVIDDKA